MPRTPGRVRHPDASDTLRACACSTSGLEAGASRRIWAGLVRATHRGSSTRPASRGFSDPRPDHLPPPPRRRGIVRDERAGSCVRARSNTNARISPRSAASRRLTSRGAERAAREQLASADTCPAAPDSVAGSRLAKPESARRAPVDARVARRAHARAQCEGEVAQPTGGTAGRLELQPRRRARAQIVSRRRRRARGRAADTVSVRRETRAAELPQPRGPSRSRIRPARRRVERRDQHAIAEHDLDAVEAKRAAHGSIAGGPFAPRDPSSEPADAATIATCRGTSTRRDGPRQQPLHERVGSITRRSARRRASRRRDVPHGRAANSVGDTGDADREATATAIRSGRRAAELDAQERARASAEGDGPARCAGRTRATVGERQDR